MAALASVANAVVSNSRAGEDFPSRSTSTKSETAPEQSASPFCRSDAGAYFPPRAANAYIAARLGFAPCCSAIGPMPAMATSWATPVYCGPNTPWAARMPMAPYPPLDGLSWLTAPSWPRIGAAAILARNLVRFSASPGRPLEIPKSLSSAAPIWPMPSARPCVAPSSFFHVPCCASASFICAETYERSASAT
ncbi:Uncharacterised protein [Mycobacteroides abscessus subsp. abscessus]|nr:Uncharacterised protein [Mycobacteroides abscessus subsp. abscessus]